MRSLGAVVAGIVVGFALGNLVGIESVTGSSPAQSAGSSLDGSARSDMVPADEVLDAELSWAGHNLLVLSGIENGDVEGAVAMLHASLLLNAVALDEFAQVFGPTEKLASTIAKIGEYRRRVQWRSEVPEADEELDRIVASYRRSTE